MMDALINFIFSGKPCRQAMFLDPDFDSLVFVVLRNEDGDKEFGKKLTVRTQDEQYSKINVYHRLLELRKTIFATVKNTEQLISAMRKWQSLGLA
jgi:hypothetical protein